MRTRPLGPFPVAAIVTCALAASCAQAPAPRTEGLGIRGQGVLDKEVIRQVIRSNRDQIRGCYEAQLARFSDLHGKVTVKFVISAEGAVAKAEVTQSSAGNPELEQCVASSVRTWTFPKPRGGGVVVVTYPFIFQQNPDAAPPGQGDAEGHETPRTAPGAIEI